MEFCLNLSLNFELRFALETMQQEEQEEHLAHLVISALMMRRGAKSRFGTAIDRPTHD